MENKNIKILTLMILVTFPMMELRAGSGNHHAAFFAGGTNTSSSTYPTLGLEYEYRTPLWDKKIGVGVVAERIFKSGFSGKKADILVAGVIIHPWKALKFNLSAGTEFIDSKNKTVIRVGTGYDFHYENVSFGPVYNLDRIDDKNAHVFGVAVGMGF